MPIQVAEFLRDDGVEAWAADCLANLLRKEIDPMWAHIGHEKRIHADMRPSLMPVCDVRFKFTAILTSY